MNEKDFVERLSKRYPNAASNTPVSDEQKEDTQFFLEGLNLMSLQLEAFYNKLVTNYTHQYRYFPEISDIKRTFEETRSANSQMRDWYQYQPEYMASVKKNMSVDDIVNKVDEIRSRGSNMASEVLFVGTWEPLVSAYGHFEDMGLDIGVKNSRLEEIKQKIINGEEVEFDVVDLKEKLNLSGGRYKGPKSFGEILEDMGFGKLQDAE